MNDDQVHELIAKMKRSNIRFDRKQAFDFYTRNLTEDQKKETEKRLRELWNVSR